MMANSNKPRPAPKQSNLYNITDQIDAALGEFQSHAFGCSQCRHPIRNYESRKGFCPVGTQKVNDIIALFYKRAELEPKGSFIAEYTIGDTCIDELIKVICHYKQGEYTNRVVDLKRAHPRRQTAPISPPPSPRVGRGSAFTEDLRRKERAAARPTFPREDSGSSTMAVYGDPNTSFLDIPSNRPQHHSSGSSNGSKGVRFDNRLHVREFIQDDESVVGR